MTKTAAVSANGRHFWAYDVSISFLAYEILVVGREQAPGQWFDGLADPLTAVAIVGGSVGLDLAPVVEADAVESFAAIADEAGARLRALGSVTEADAEARRIAGHPVIWRSIDNAAMPSAPIADLAEAMVELVRGQLPKPPPGAWWYLGLPGGPRTIKMNGPSSG
ncbi:hypothetical protein [Krasilnikovia sp. M28-CT-15]|uniref:hypothetical protein n=1 Tax=Krasilnikovia sp. M28-CT-15 TaxID=3373540 RepID=UPI0038778E27